MRGLVALLNKSCENYDVPFHYRLPEYMSLYQKYNSYTYDNTPTYLFQMILVDSVLWDTVTPHYLPIRQGATSNLYEYCLAYEAYFNKPVSVDSTFYIYGTQNSNTHWPVEGDSLDRYHYIPTWYVEIAMGTYTWDDTGPNTGDCHWPYDPEGYENCKGHIGFDMLEP